MEVFTEKHVLKSGGQKFGVEKVFSHEDYNVIITIILINTIRMSQTGCWISYLDAY